MKKTFIYGGAFTVALLGTYAGLWHVNSGHLAQETGDLLSGIQQGMGGQILTYSSINSEGFPGSPTVSIKNPKISIPNAIEISTPKLNLIRSIFHNSIAESIPEDLLFKISAPLTGGAPLNFTYRTAGGRAEATFRGNSFMNFLTTKLSLNPLKGQDISEDNIKSLILNDFESFEVKNNSSELSSNESDKTILKSGPSKFKLSMNQIAENNHRIDLIFSSKDTEYTEEADKIMVKLADILQQISGQKTSYLKFMKPSAYGKINSNIDLSYKGPLDLQAFETTGGTIEVDIKDYEGSDNMQNHKAKGNILINMAKGQLLDLLKVKLDGSMKVTKEFQDFITQLYKSMAQAQLDQMASAGDTPNADHEKVVDMLDHILTMYSDKIIPDFSKMGELKYAVDLNYNHNDNSFNGDVSFSTDHFGFSLKGEGQPQKLNIELTLKNYQEFIDTLYNYSRGLLEVAHEVSNGTVNIQLKDEMKHQIIELLKKLAEKQEAGSKDMIIKLAVDGDQVKIGNLSMPELMMTMMMLAPMLQGMESQANPALPQAPGAIEGAPAPVEHGNDKGTEDHKK